MSGVDLHADGAEPRMRIRKGAADAVRGFVESTGGIFPQPVGKTVDEIPIAAARRWSWRRTC